MDNTEIVEPKKNTKTHVVRLLQALAKIYEDPGASIPERLQATRLAMDAMDRRPVPKRKTDLDKLREEALKKALSKKKAPPVKTEP
jgi:hypothetical protein